MGIPVSLSLIHIYQDRTIVAKVILPTGAGASNGAQRALDQALQQAGLTQADLTATVTTGYGRGVIQTGEMCIRDRRRTP